MHTPATPRRYLRERALAEHLSVHRSTLRRWVARGLMPAPIRLGLRTVVWDAEEIEHWQAARAAAPRGQPE
ncbi:helix-turn-helix transcriptional regulator [Thiorhodococcus minor]|uniref:AlpA family phage regulatory protein n=1 Tax=Thiorhodococcus minor TaxID=57489 RepID=A0A6M0JVH2_9GAMM|nr:AlpA family phage regulatory protein [Thiorhodococcus minor]NEV60317.1 AlpA family phage regulatory protein [Thiorhodococcus minor]